MIKDILKIKKYIKTQDYNYLSNLDYEFEFVDLENQHPKPVFYVTKLTLKHLLLKTLGIKIYRVIHIYDEVYYCTKIKLFIHVGDLITYFDDIDDFTHDEEWKEIVKERIEELL